MDTTSDLSSEIAWKLNSSEIIVPKSIPFSEIIEIMVPDNYIRGRVLRLMCILLKYNVNLVFPVYNAKSKMIWPIIK